MKPVDVLLAILVSVLWGMGFIVAKAGMSHFSPILLMALRFTLTASLPTPRAVQTTILDLIGQCRVTVQPDL
jgi:O-acetylserine/cysteine efflux transporter